MSTSYAATVARAINVETWVSRAEALFDELVGLDGGRLVATLSPGWGVEDVAPFAPVPRAQLGDYEVGLHRPDFHLEFRVGDGAWALAVALPSHDPEGSTDASVSVSPVLPNGASLVLVACVLAACAELADGVVDEFARDFVGEPTTDAAGLLSALRRKLARGLSSEERARERLRPLPGFRDSWMIQEPAPKEIDDP